MCKLCNKVLFREFCQNGVSSAKSDQVPVSNRIGRVHVVKLSHWLILDDFWRNTYYGIMYSINVRK